jgi:hypothetical protein
MRRHLAAYDVVSCSQVQNLSFKVYSNLCIESYGIAGRYHSMRHGLVSSHAFMLHLKTTERSMLKRAVSYRKDKDILELSIAASHMWRTVAACPHLFCTAVLWILSISSH